ncbi:DUF4350 domain-containing protein [filamentous cyanobacterium LEGE 11480]|uniref:DUF4350 domain-containing protein n=1 Tax=Romeriopsis navalis LEGE 11480 TaxID=2777977 RepID=A0A928VNE1_9CYAN|nr:DUF4350 domain-containing protein [Romeriopsis navalis]MBE9031783.1 DUF4350 domain-containing protein [Romeriopsis navalis LEGE 11480]
MQASSVATLKSSRRLWLIVGGIVLVLILSLVLAPTNNWKRSGSTYNRAPDGYAAWYDYMTQRGEVELVRSRQPIDILVEHLSSGDSQSPQTLLQIQPQFISANRWQTQRRSSAAVRLSAVEQQWLAAGNNLIVLGLSQPVRDVEFSSLLLSDFGPIRIETRRRAQVKQGKSLLKDEAGAVVWEMLPNPPGKSDDQPSRPSDGSVIEIVDKPKPRIGRLIFATTPHFAANAYQSEAGNFEFLADLMAQMRTPILVDEAIHGYREPLSKGAARQRTVPTQANSLLNYLAQTPLLPITVQAVVILLIAIWAKNRRFGRIKRVEPPQIDNSTAYIQALAGALRQANSRSFVMDTVGQAELRMIQQQLGLGSAPMELPEMIQAWAAQQQPTDELKALLRMQSRQNLSDRELLEWLQNLQRLRQRVQ